MLKRVSSLLQVAFRSTDFVCRIGGDEFAVIMADMTSDLRYTIQEKIDFVNTELSKPIDGMPQVSLSAGAAFADRPDPGDSIYKDADDALYHTKENGRGSCSFYGEFVRLNRKDARTQEACTSEKRYPAHIAEPGARHPPGSDAAAELRSGNTRAESFFPAPGP